MKVQVNGSFSIWVEVLNGVPQSSVLGPLLFLIYVHDLPDWVLNSIMMFADDTKIWTKIQTPDDKEALPQDLDRLVEWSKRWLLEFSVIYKTYIWQTSHRILCTSTKILQRMKKLSYECRLKQLHIHTLEQWRIRGDLIETFKKDTKGQRTDQC